MPIEAARAVYGGKAPRQYGAMEYSEAPVTLIGWAPKTAASSTSATSTTISPAPPLARAP